MEEEEGEEVKAQEGEDEAKVQVEVEGDDCNNDEQIIVVWHAASPVMTHIINISERKKKKKKEEKNDNISILQYHNVYI